MYCSSACRQRAYRRRLREASHTEPSELYDQEVPLALDSFVGRKQELVAVCHLVRTNRLVTLSGPVGVGKTRLGLEAAARVSRRFSGGVVLVELGRVDDAGPVVAATAAALGVAATIDAVVMRLRENEILLVLNDCENVVTACAEIVATLLRRCPALHVVVTSRESLHLPGEQVFAVPALPADDAMALFAGRVRSVVPEFRVGADDRTLVESICLHLDHLPLAIEFAARLTRLFPLEAILAGIRVHRFDFLVARRAEVRPGTAIC